MFTKWPNTLQILQNSGRNFLNVYLTILWKLVVIGLTVINSLKTFLAHIKQIFGPSSYLILNASFDMLLLCCFSCTILWYYFNLLQVIGALLKSKSTKVKMPQNHLLPLALPIQNIPCKFVILYNVLVYSLRLVSWDNTIPILILLSKNHRAFVCVRSFQTPTKIILLMMS